MSLDRVFSTGMLAILAALVWGGAAWLSLGDRPKPAEAAGAKGVERSIAAEPDRAVPANPAAVRPPVAFGPGRPEPVNAEQFRADAADRAAPSAANAGAKGPAPGASEPAKSEEFRADTADRPAPAATPPQTRARRAIRHPRPVRHHHRRPHRWDQSR